MSFLCDIDITENKSLLLSPVLQWSTIFKKTHKVKILGDLGNEVRLKIHSYSLPALIPEIGCMLSLDISSENLRRDFEQKTVDFESLENNLITSDFYNFDPSLNRLVSRGNYKFHHLSKNDHKLYVAAMLTDFLITPSIFIAGNLYTPLRWFRIYTRNEYFFKSDVYYNKEILYFNNEDLRRARKFTIWIGEPLDLFRVECQLIQINKTGDTWSKKINVFFRNEPKDMIDDSSKGNYYVSFILSLNDYKTSFKKEGVFLPYDKSINIIDYVSPLIYSKYDIILHMFPFFVNVNSLKDPLIKFEVKEEVVLKIISRFIKFGNMQNKEMIDFHDKFFEDFNPFVKIFLNEGVYYVIIFNPGVIYSLLKHSVSNNVRIRKCAKDFLGNYKSLISEFENPNELKHMMIPILSGLWSIEECRNINLWRYVELFRKMESKQTPPRRLRGSR